MRREADGGRPEIVVLANRQAGRRGGRSVRRLEEQLARVGFACDVRVTEGRHFDKELRRLVAGGVRTIGVGGGDGTIRSAADILAGSETVLAPLPLGTLNHFARRVGLGTLEAAVAAMRTGRETRVPIGIVDEHVFLNTATIGLYADVVQRRDRLGRVIGKWPAAVLSSAATLVGKPPIEVELDVAGSRRYESTPLVWVGLGRRTFPFTHEAPVERGDPELEVVILRPGYRLASAALFMRLLLRLLRGKNPRDDAALEMIHARCLLIRSAAPVGGTLDGEVFRFAAPLFVAVQADGLRVVAPYPDP